MKNANTYEHLHFQHTINTINSDYFPTQYPLHWHKYAEIIALPTDSSPKHLPVIKINQDTYTLHPGDLLILWPGEIHEIINNRDKLLFGLQFPGTILNEHPDFVPFVNLFRSFHLISIEKEEQLACTLMKHMQKIFSLQEKKEIFSDVRTSICLHELFIDFGSYLHETLQKDFQELNAQPDKTLEKINLACTYIQENCEQALTLTMVAEHVGFSTYYMSRLFKQITSYSFVEYLTWQRIKLAQRLLADSQVSITEVSYQAGFKSISTFNRVFHQYLGCSPRDYRKSYLKGHDGR